MEFLVNSIASENDGSMLGVVLTSFDVTKYTSRAEVKLFSTEEFMRVYPTLQPMGFSFSDDGVLLSDTVTRRAITDSVFSYMEQECGKFGYRDLDVIDLVLFGVEENGLVIPDYLSVEDKSEVVEMASFVPFKNFKVSNSSFNIYAPYQNKEGMFRTASLLNPEDGSGKEMTVAFPAEVDLSQFEKLCPESVQVIHIGGNEKEYIVYRIDTSIIPYYTSVGEAFLNYLAYNVAFYRIGEETLKGLSPQIEIVSAPTPDVKVEREVRKVRGNVAIDHCYRNSQLTNIVNRLSDMKLLEEYLNTDPEAYITYQWIRKAYNSPWFNTNTDHGTEEQLLATSCMNLLFDCRRDKLKYALELLAHRYYIYSMGRVNDNLNIVLKGGGVGGEAVKRFNIG